MILKLTNAVKEHKGKILLINTRFVVSMFEDTTIQEGKKKTAENVTTIYSATQQSWNVKESISDIYKMIGEHSNV
jgi:hypothetical protein